jgi:hypothetical protein
MRRFPILSIYAVLLVFLLTTACGTAPASSPTENPAPTADPSDEQEGEEDEIENEMENEMEEEIEPTVDFAGDLADFDSAQFDDPTHITNTWFPLTPGRQIVLDGVAEEAGLEFSHQIIFTVTDLTKEIYGIQTVVAWIEDYSDGDLVEAELAFYAQANDGTVWFMGEHPEVYEYGVMVEAPTWISGYKGALPGISMNANPVAGMPSYSQGWGPAVNWTDRAQVIETGVEVCVPVGCYDNVVVIEEFNKTEPDAFQIKYWAPGVGNIKVGWRGDDANHEDLEMVELNELSAEEMAEIRATALEMEAHAYEISKEVYALTEPAK